MSLETLIDSNTATDRFISTQEPGPDSSRVEVLGEAVVLPKDLLDRYVAVALRSARPREIEEGRWYVDIDQFRGVWADGDSPKTCLDSVAEVLEDWIILKIADKDKDLPVVDGIDLNFLSR
jgi:predicted RNase H-like HicB family nuclease